MESREITKAKHGIVTDVLYPTSLNFEHDREAVTEALANVLGLVDDVLSCLDHSQPTNLLNVISGRDGWDKDEVPPLPISHTDLRLIRHALEHTLIDVGSGG